MAEMKNALDIINSRLCIAGEIISELEDIATEIMQNEIYMEKMYNLKNEQDISKFWDNFKILIIIAVGSMKFG